MIKLEAFHCTQYFFGIRHYLPKAEKLERGFHWDTNYTHFKIGEYEVNDCIPIMEALAIAFQHFNWVSSDFVPSAKAQLTIKEHNEANVQYHHIHTSMTAGDIVKVNGDFWYCNDVGWYKLS